MKPDRQQPVPEAGTDLRNRILLPAGWLITSLVLVVAYCWVLRPDLRFWPGMVTHGKTTLPQVALTFDDGPHPLWMPLLADTLSRHGARGTFFVVGSQAMLYPELISRVNRAGHLVANHSMWHPYPNLGVRSRADVKSEIDDASRVLLQLTDKPCRDFRPPGGGMNDAVIEEIKARNMRLAWWSRNIDEYNPTPPHFIANVLHWYLQPGDIALLHEREWTVAGLEEFLSQQRQHLSFVTFDEIAQQ